MSIRYKIMIVFLAVILITSMLLISIWYKHSTDMVNTYMEDISENTMSDAYSALNYVISDTAYTMTLVSTNQNNIVQPVKELNTITLEENGQYGPNFLASSRTIKGYLHSMVGYKSYIVGIGVVSNNSIVVQTSNVVENEELLYSLSDQHGTAFTGQAITMLPRVKTSGTWSTQKSNYVIPTVQPIYNDSRSVIGYTFLYFDYSVIEEIFESYLPENSLFQVVDRDGYLVYSNTGDFIDTAENGTYAFNNYYASSVDWTFTMGIPTQPIRAKAQGTLRLTIAFVCATLFLAVVVSALVTSRITGNIKLLSSKMDSVANGDFTITKDISSHDEIEQMEQNFNQMIAETKLLLETIAQEEKQKRLIEIAFLQAQINPHFISNVLNLLAWMGKVKQADNIVLLTNSLNQMLHGVMKSTNDLIPLSEEIEHVKSFLTIIEYTGNYDFDVIIDIPTETQNQQVLRFILQPIVENAVYHGMQTSLDQVGLLEIKAENLGNNLIITISDNGRGMSPKRLKEIFNNKSPIPSGFNGIGINNVQERIQLFYGESYSLSYKSEEGKYTRAVFCLPLINTEEDNSAQG